MGITLAAFALVDVSPRQNSELEVMSVVLTFKAGRFAELLLLRPPCCLTQVQWR